MSGNVFTTGDGWNFFFAILNRYIYYTGHCMHGYIWTMKGYQINSVLPTSTKFRLNRGIPRRDATLRALLRRALSHSLPRSANNLVIHTRARAQLRNLIRASAIQTLRSPSLSLPLFLLCHDETHLSARSWHWRGALFFLSPASEGYTHIIYIPIRASVYRRVGSRSLRISLKRKLPRPPLLYLCILSPASRYHNSREGVSVKCF